MLRIMDCSLLDQSGGFRIVNIEQGLQFNKGMWQRARDCFRQDICYDPVVMPMVSVLDEQQRLIGYGWQDAEADRELRMLRELDETKDAVRFCDVFPDIREVIVYGCNELAYYFVKYLEHSNVKVMVSGKYWKYLHYQDVGDVEAVAGSMIVLAEPITNARTDLFQRVARSSSSEFECIDCIYEKNVLAGKIRDAEGGVECFFEKLRGKNVAILGVDERAQDAYDLLYQHGIDIKYFLVKNVREYIPMTLLGKQINTLEEIMRSEKDIVFLDVWGRKSALGTANVDLFEYYGYRRNEQFFLINDYTDVPYSNLVHVLNGKKLFLAGDKVLCEILAEYLEKVENGDISVEFIEITQLDNVDFDERILCTVHPWCGDVENKNNPGLYEFREQLKKIRNCFYSNYFSRAGTFVLIDEYMNQNREKYTHRQLIPKGILLGAMPWMSGNVLIRGLLDGHPNILKVSFDELNNNLFWYCIRLARERSKGFLYSEKDSSFFPDWNFFKESIKRVHLEDEATPQEILLAFHIVYMESIRKNQVDDLTQMVVYWEPHLFPREERSFLAKWLESVKINGNTLVTRRNHVVWFGSNYKWYDKDSSVVRLLSHISMMSCEDYSYEIPLHHWKEFTMRFEDIKLHPKEELLRLCDMVGIPWSDTMLHTTNDGRELVYGEGIMDFDMKPVFNPYEEFLSEFDRFRVCLVSSAYQKKYGYVYENCLRFSRSELQEMFLKKFRFQDLMQLKTDMDKITYYLCAYALLRQQMWEARKHIVLNDVIPEFKPVEIGSTYTEGSRKQKELERLMKFIKAQKKLILYGIGRDCKGLWQRLEEVDKERILFCDKKAIQDECSYQGKRVLAPTELCTDYSEYGILITSSQFGSRIQMELENMGISRRRIECNTVSFWEAQAENDVHSGG